MTGLLSLYRAQFKTTIAGMLQYRGALVIWLLDLLLEPIIYLAVWRAVARAQGGEVDGFTAGDFAAYFVVTMMVNHATFTWIMWEFEWRVRQGTFSPQLLRPVHPIHKDIADNLGYKFLTLAVMVPAAVVLALVFDARFDTSVWAVLAFVPALVFAYAIRFAIEWTLAMTAFWTTRNGAVNQMYYPVVLFLSGQAAPLALYPEPVQVLAALLPFRWFVAFPTELVLGRLSVQEALVGFGAQAAWVSLAALILGSVWRRGIRRYSAVGA